MSAIGQTQQSEHDLPLRIESGALNRDYVNRITANIEADDGLALNGLISNLHIADVADIIEAISPELRVQFISLLGEAFDYEVLTELDDSLRNELLDQMPNVDLAKAMRSLDTDDAVYILEDMEQEDQDDILSQIPVFERMSLERSLDFPEDSVGRRLQSDFIAIPPFWSIGQTIDYMRETDNLPDEFYQIYVVDPTYKLLGTVPLNTLLRTKRSELIQMIMDSSLHQIAATKDQEEAALEFERYNLVELAAVDEHDRLLGVLTIDDVVDVIHEEAEEDILRLGGVGDEDIFDSVWTATRSRFSWLFVNLVTSIVASLVIAQFDATLEQMVALAILMPIVASMGGNAGTQTMTIAVRALATRNLDIYNARRIINREFLVGILNGIIFAVLMALVAMIWFGNVELGGVIAGAMIFNMICAGLAGILIPLLLDHFRIDPALASSVFVTTVTDVVGFFVFLGLAAWWFGI